MANINAGSAEGGSAPEPQGEPEGRGDSKTRILIAVIGGAAIVTAAIVAALLGRSPDGSPPSGRSDPCDLNRLGDFWNQPPSQRYNQVLFADRLRPRVYSAVSPDSNPEVSVKGQLNLNVPAGQVLYLIRRPDPKTKDQEGNPGNNRFYPATPVTPTSAGCWEDANRPVGYPGVKGIGQTYMLVLVGRDQAAQFPADRKSGTWDGYSHNQWRAINTIDVMSFYISTA
ncbi:hypothetical protein [Streptomyces spectabilis]|uniref:Uncharacterized protein n=1 Tax=Streptomyces spectabilis TaxID=68270 RepID=A0A516R173_STRST|nr:hypothetical protein [Streptomyces spectabilis]QDQ09409.1 hypothetical protein FH965_01525 [Streptomyces spectabilis]